MQLYNKYDKNTLLKKIEQEPFKRITISFYQYAHIDDPAGWRDELYEHLEKLGILGRIYVAKEGINAQINCPEPNVEAFRDYLYSFSFLEGIRLNIAVEQNNKSFVKLAVKVRDKIVADGIDDPDFKIDQKGKYLNAEEFNQLTEDPNTVLIDMRNHYEYEVGHFENAIEIPSDAFRDQLPMAVDMMKENKDKKIIMYCTGGIRCEKASAYMKHNGFENVYHLEGGIIHYTNVAKEQGIPNKFIGKNFVFDERLGERITQDIISNCHQCGDPCDDHTNCVNPACHLLFIQCKKCAEKYEGCCSDECVEFIHLPFEQQRELRKGTNFGANVYKTDGAPGSNIFKKGRWPQDPSEKKFNLPE
jgi:UPF0176 protein